MKSSFEKIPRQPYRSFYWWIRESEKFPFEWHHHPELELTLILEGEGQRMIGPNVEQYAPQDLVLIGSNIPHTYVSSDESGKMNHKAIVIQFDTQLIEQYQDLFPETRELNLLLKNSAYGLDYETSTLKEDIIQDIIALTQLDEAFQPNALMAILIKINRAKSRNIMLAKSYQQFIQDKSHQRIEKVYEYLHENFTIGVHLSEIANLVNMNEASFCRFFKKVTSKTVSQYVKEMRIAYAAKLLTDTDLNVTQVAYNSGYNDLSNFSRHFKELKQKSPVKFRKHFSPQTN